jgi:homoserine dehydrogenase
MIEYRTIRVGLLGAGSVGSQVARLLIEHSDELTQRIGARIELVGIAVRDIGAKRHPGVPVELLTTDADSLILGSDIVIELMGGIEPAKTYLLQAINSGADVVTANKALLAKHGVELAALAEEKGAILNFEAAVAGGIPVIKALRESLTGNTVSRVYGIMNGTCNYILTRMEREELSFEACLKEAQRLGYAEADPAFDIEGNDTAHKLSILTTLAFGTKIAADDIYLEGITNISLDDIHAAADLGYRIKLLGVAQKTSSGIEQRVHPTMVPQDSVIAQVDGVTNAVAIESDVLGELLMVGPGAGGNATASAVMGDIADIAKSRPGAQLVPSLGRPALQLDPYIRGEMQSHEGGYFIRLTVQDRTGVFASVATRMAENQISLESIMQRPRTHDDQADRQTIILVTHATTEKSVRNAVATIKTEGYLLGEPQVIRIERPKAN